MQLDLVTPERSLASLEIQSVQLPGMNGDLTAMPNHAPLLTTLRPGVVRVESADARDEYLVTGGFAEISPEAISILAEQAVPLADANAAMVDGLVAEAEAQLETADDESRAAAAQRVNDLGQLKGLIG